MYLVLTYLHPHDAYPASKTSLGQWSLNVPKANENIIGLLLAPANKTWLGQLLTAIIAPIMFFHGKLMLAEPMTDIIGPIMFF